jgi:glycosyltransferase involved in cell wall biosynthesis
MTERYGTRTPVHIVPNGIDVAMYSTEGPVSNALPRNGKRRLIFTAAFGYPPNIRAARFLTEELWPRLTATEPETELILAGSSPSAQMIEASRRDRRIVVTGTVEDTRPYIASASAMIVPLFEGSGTRFKILEAFASGIPVITTAKGAEGLEVESERDLLIAETADEFVAGVKRLWRDTGLNRLLTENALLLVRCRYSWDVARRQIVNAIRDLQGTRRQSLESTS